MLVASTLLVSLTRSPDSFPCAIFGLGWPALAWSRLWDLVEHPVMRKTSIPGWALGSACPGEAAGNYCAEGCWLPVMSRTCKASSDGVDGARGEAGPPVKATLFLPLGVWVPQRQPGAGAEWARATCWLGPGWGSLCLTRLCSVIPAPSSPESRKQLCVLLKAGQEMGCPRVGTVSPYWASPLVHFDCVAWIKWAVRRSRCHPQLCNCRRVPSSSLRLPIHRMG